MGGYQHYYIYLETWDYRQLWIAVAKWKNSFSGSYGWGTNLINAQKALHHSLIYLKKRKSPELKRQMISENHFFAHCVSEISDIDRTEIILADFNMRGFHHKLASFARDNWTLMSSHYEELFNINGDEIWQSLIDNFDISEAEVTLVVESFPKRERSLVENIVFGEWPIDEFIYGIICDSLWKIIDNRIKEAEDQIEMGEVHSLGIISNWLNIYNFAMEKALGNMFGKEAYISIQLGDVNDFPIYIVDNILERIDYNYAEGYGYPLISFRKLVLDLRRSIDSPEWYKNEIHFGRFLEWINIFKAVVE